jgi:hypothetical protein
MNEKKYPRWLLIESEWSGIPPDKLEIMLRDEQDEQEEKPMTERITLTEWAMRNRLSVSRASRLLKAGRISAIKVGGIWLVDDNQPKPPRLRRKKKQDTVVEQQEKEQKGEEI